MSSESSGAARNAAAAVAAHVVVACDDNWIGHLLDSHLGRAGYGTVRVGNGRDLLEWLRSESQPSIVLLSLHGTLPHDRAVLEVVAADPALATRHTYGPADGALGPTAGRLSCPTAAPGRVGCADAVSH